jgi:hypothetical protein
MRLHFPEAVLGHCAWRPCYIGRRQPLDGGKEGAEASLAISPLSVVVGARTTGDGKCMVEKTKSASAPARCEMVWWRWRMQRRHRRVDKDGLGRLPLYRLET